MSGIQDIESNNEAMICTGDNPAHNQTMYKDVYKYIFYQGCLNPQHTHKLNVDFGRKLDLFSEESPIQGVYITITAFIRARLKCRL